MSFKFLHTADWQIGKRFANFPAEKAALLREARLGAVDRLALAARSCGAGHVLVAGDVFDTETPEPQTRRKCFERLRHNHDLVWHLLPGNHDPARVGGIWERSLAEGIPENVRVHAEQRPVEIADRAWLLPAPLTSRASRTDPTAWMDQAGLPEGSLRIGLAHGSVHGFGGESGRPIDVDRVATAGLSYLALGDWHGMKEVTPRAWYSGTPEPDRFPDNEPGYALAVTVPGPAGIPDVRPVATAKYRWASLRLRLTYSEDLSEIEAQIRALSPDPANLVVDVTLDGLVSLSDRAAIVHGLERIEAAFFHLQTDLQGLRLRPADDDLDRIDRAGELRAAAERLMAMAQDRSSPEAGLAEGALARLYVLAVDEAAIEAKP